MNARIRILPEHQYIREHKSKDLSLEPKDKTSIVIGDKEETKHREQLKDFHFLEDLHVVGPIKDDLFEVVCSLKSLKILRILDFRVKDISPISNLDNLEILVLDGNNSIDDLSSVGKLQRLKGLAIREFHKLQNIDFVASLTSLEALAIEEGWHHVMNVDSLQPIAPLKNLQSLSLIALKTRDIHSVRVIADLKKLKYLSFSNFYDWQDVAYLAGKLKGVECSWFSPVKDMETPCPVCNAELVKLTKVGRNVYCNHCDKELIEKFVKEFNEVKSLNISN